VRLCRLLERKVTVGRKSKVSSLSLLKEEYSCKSASKRSKPAKVEKEGKD